jgi:hypothetical protein
MFSPPDITKGIDKLFKVKKIQYNTYDVDHPTIKGQLRIITIPQNFIEMPKIPTAPPNHHNIILASQTLVSFTNKGSKKTPTSIPVTPQIAATAKKEDMTRFYENSNEPWCEFILQGNPPLVARVKTVLTRVEWLTEHVNPQGDPILWAFTNVNVDIFEEKSGESGLK